MILSPLEQFSVLSISDFSLEPLVIGQSGSWSSLWMYHFIIGLEGLSNNIPFFGEGSILKYLGCYSLLNLVSATVVCLGQTLEWLCFSVFGTPTFFTSSANPTFHGLLYMPLSFFWLGDQTPSAMGLIETTELYSFESYSFSLAVVLVLVSFIHTCCSSVFTLFLGNLFQCASETHSLSGLSFSINTSSIWLSLGFVFTVFLFLTCVDKVTLISKNRWQTLVENYYQVVWNVVNDSAGSSGIKFFPLIFTVFTIILVCNLLGMIPYSFTVTSHLIVTFSMALAVFLGINALGILKNGRHFLSLFFPPGAPLGLAPLLVAIEIVSYVFRVLSLAIRLFANLMSGHTLLKILSGFAWSAVSIFGIFLLPLGVILLVTGLEVAIACLQAYIFCVLLCIYINDAFNLH